jgi:hypothetical protein
MNGPKAMSALSPFDSQLRTSVGATHERICHLAMEGERDPVRLHDRALGELIPATIWRELS